MITIVTPRIWTEPGLLCREQGTPLRKKQPETEDSGLPAVDQEESVYCRSCRSPVTTSRQAVSVNSAHQHTFFNPAGIVYEICCYSRADGCAVHGEPTSEFSWFAGCRWRYAICATCLVHLGWLFSSPVDAFFGLIRARLIIQQG